MRLRAYPYDAVSTSMANVDWGLTAGSTSAAKPSPPYPALPDGSGMGVAQGDGAAGATGLLGRAPATPPFGAEAWRDEGEEQPVTVTPATTSTARTVRIREVMPVRRAAGAGGAVRHRY